MSEPTRAAPRPDHRLERACLRGAILLALIYLFVAFVLPHWRPLRLAPDGIRPPSYFGFIQYRRLGLPGAAALFLALGAILRLQWTGRISVGDSLGRGGRWLLERPVRAAMASGLAALVFFAFRNQFINSDGASFEKVFADNVAIKGFQASHDELWELYLHSRLWAVLHPRWGWSAVDIYHVVSSVAGGAFVFLLLHSCRLWHPSNPLALALLVASGGLMQLYFGDVENYSLAGVAILLYLHVSALCLRGRLSIVSPSVALAMAMMTHMLAGFLLPSLALLWLWESRDGRWREALLGLLCFILIVVLTLMFFDWRGLPLRNLVYHSHALGHGGHYANALDPPRPGHLWEQLNVLALLFPGWWLIVPLLWRRRIAWTRANVHLASGVLFLLPMLFLWHPSLGVYNDWNLYANAALPFSILVWANLLQSGRSPRMTAILIALFTLSAGHSYTWIIANHFRP